MEGEVHADAEVGGEDNACFFGGSADGGFARIVEACCADDDADTFFHAFLQVFESRLGAGKVDEYVASCENGVNVV